MESCLFPWSFDPLMAGKHPKRRNNTYRQRYIVAIGDVSHGGAVRRKKERHGLPETVVVRSLVSSFSHLRRHVFCLVKRSARQEHSSRPRWSFPSCGRCRLPAFSRLPLSGCGNKISGRLVRRRSKQCLAVPAPETRGSRPPDPAPQEPAAADGWIPRRTHPAPCAPLESLPPPQASSPPSRSPTREPVTGAGAGRGADSAGAPSAMSPALRARIVENRCGWLVPRVSPRRRFSWREWVGLEGGWIDGMSVWGLAGRRGALRVVGQPPGGGGGGKRGKSFFLSSCWVSFSYTRELLSAENQSSSSPCRAFLDPSPVLVPPSIPPLPCL